MLSEQMASGGAGLTTRGEVARSTEATDGQTLWLISSTTISFGKRACSIDRRRAASLATASDVNVACLRSVDAAAHSRLFSASPLDKSKVGGCASRLLEAHR